jgi:hypothetical protein
LFGYVERFCGISFSAAGKLFCLGETNLEVADTSLVVLLNLGEKSPQFCNLVCEILRVSNRHVCTE